MNILLINHYAGSTGHGMEYRPFYLAREWIKLGHTVAIVGASFSHVRTKNPEVKSYRTEEELEGIHYVWLKTPSYQGNGFGRILNMLNFVFLLFRYRGKFVKQYKPDVVIVSSTYPLDIYPAYLISKKTGAKLFFEVHDLWPLSPIEIGGISPRHPYIMLMQLAENFAYRNAYKVVSILPKALSHMLAHGMAAHKFVYLPNGIAVEEWRNSNEVAPQYSDILNQIKENGNFLVGYAGAHGLANALETLINAAALLKSQPVTLVLVGQGPEKEMLQEKVSQEGLTNVIFLPPVSKTAIPNLLSLMDALYIGLSKTPLFRFGICPNKLLDYMMAGRPIVYAIEAGNDPVAESGCGISVPPEMPDEVAKAITDLMAMKLEQREAMGLRGKEFVLANHDYQSLARKFLDQMED